MKRFLLLIVLANFIFSCSIPGQYNGNTSTQSAQDDIQVLFSSENDNYSRAEGISSGSGYINDLKASIRSGNDAPATMDGYTKIPVDLNEGAGGKFIYLYYNKSASTTSSLCYLNVVYFSFMKLTWQGAYPTGAKNCSYPYMKYLGKSFANGMWTDLNQGSGGKYIYVEGTSADLVNGWIFWCAQNFYNPGWIPNTLPIKDILIFSSGGSYSSSTYKGYTVIPVDLNKGAGGKYIYLCYKK